MHKELGKQINIYQKKHIDNMTSVPILSIRAHYITHHFSIMVPILAQNECSSQYAGVPTSRHFSRESAKQVHIEYNAHEIWFAQSLSSLYLGYLSTISIYNMLRSPGCVASILEG